LESTRRALRAFKELHTQLVGAMLVHSATNKRVPLPHWSDVVGVIHAIHSAKLRHPDVPAWQWERLAQVKEASTRILDPEARKAILEHENTVLKLVREQPKAPESVVRFVANARTNGRIYSQLARTYREIAENPSFTDITKASLASMAFKHFTL